jgi:SAM-dependent methyltransferase
VKVLLLRALERLRLLRPAYRSYERLTSLRARGAPADAGDGLPVPPPRLIVRVAGTPDPRWFIEGGRLAADAIRGALGRQGVDVGDLAGILDFGCGCGRVTRNWAGLNGTRVAGTDMSAAAVAWCRANLPFARFEVNSLEPPLPFEDASFDVAYALSVFTHLPVDLQERWIGELERVTRPGGLVLLSTHGAAYRDRLTATERKRFDAGDVVVRWGEAAGTNLCTTFHPAPWVEERLGRAFDPVEFVSEGAKGNPRQDLFVFRKPGSGA